MFGQHLIVDFQGCNEKIRDGEAIKRWVGLLVKDIDMVSYGDPILEHFATHNPDAAGYTVVQLIETSHIAAEFAEQKGQIYLSLFSCKGFNSELAIRLTAEFFGAESYQKWEIKRGVFDEVFKVIKGAFQHLCGFMGRVA